MTEEILINVTPQETRVAVIQQGVVQEVQVERASARGLVGNIYMGRVVRVLPGMQSAFVDIGGGRAAFLHVADIWGYRQDGDEARPIEKLLAEGQHLLAQVVFQLGHVHGGNGLPATEVGPPLADLFLESFVRRNELFIEYSKETLAKVSGVPDLSAKELKGRILRDPVEDSLIFRLHEGADLREVWLFTAGNRLWLVAGLGGKMEPDVVYQFGLRAIKSGTAEHLDVRVLDNKISVLDLGRLWTTKDVGFQYMEPKRVAVSVPIDFIDGASHVMVNVETYGRTTDENHWIDRTAWRTVKVK